MNPRLRVVALVLARGGSKGVPGKNIALVGGKPLIAWTIEAALASTRICRLILSTDDDEIAELARAHGCEVPFRRPPELARDESTGFDVCVHALRWIEGHEGRRPDFLLVLQPTSPLRTTADIDAVIDLATETRAPAVVSVSEASQHPYNVRRLDAAGALHDFLPVTDKPERRQDFPPAYALNGALFLATPEAVLDQSTFEPPGTLAYVMPRERALDIDTPLDLQLADLLLRRS